MSSDTISRDELYNLTRTAKRAGLEVMDPAKVASFVSTVFERYGVPSAEGVTAGCGSAAAGP